MITFIENGDIFKSNCEAIINPVNCYGHNGAGLAKQFKNLFPLYDIEHIKICNLKILKPGGLYFYQLYEKPKWIIDFATKNHWRQPSQIEWIIEGLHQLKFELISKNINSVAIPALGSGLGGLDWNNQVKPAILEILNDINIVIECFEPLC